MRHQRILAVARIGKFVQLAVDTAGTARRQKCRDVTIEQLFALFHRPIERFHQVSDLHRIGRFNPGALAGQPLVQVVGAALDRKTRTGFFQIAAHFIDVGFAGDRPLAQLGLLFQPEVHQLRRYHFAERGSDIAVAGRQCGHRAEPVGHHVKPTEADRPVGIERDDGARQQQIVAYHAWPVAGAVPAFGDLSRQFAVFDAALGPAFDGVGNRDLARCRPVLSERQRKFAPGVVVVAAKFEPAVGSNVGNRLRLNGNTAFRPTHKILDRPAIAPVVVHQRAYNRRQVARRLLLHRKCGITSHRSAPGHHGLFIDMGDRVAAQRQDQRGNAKRIQIVGDFAGAAPAGQTGGPLDRLEYRWLIETRRCAEKLAGNNRTIVTRPEKIGRPDGAMNHSAIVQGRQQRRHRSHQVKRDLQCLHRWNDRVGRGHYRASRGSLEQQHVFAPARFRPIDGAPLHRLDDREVAQVTRVRNKAQTKRDLRIEQQRIKLLRGVFPVNRGKRSGVGGRQAGQWLVRQHMTAAVHRQDATVVGIIGKTAFQLRRCRADIRVKCKVGHIAAPSVLASRWAAQWADFSGAGGNAWLTAAVHFDNLTA